MTSPEMRTSPRGTEPQWLDDEELRAWKALVHVTSAVRARLENDLISAHGLAEGDYAVLVSLSEAPDHKLRMCDLAWQLHLSPSGLTRRLDGLVKLHYVGREPAADDRRVTLAVLTDDGLSALEDAAPAHVEGVRRYVLDHLTRDQMRALTDALEAVQRGNEVECDAARAAGETCGEQDANGKSAVDHS
jgi:DNA-binding MarR family transcriptional regulator